MFFVEGGTGALTLEGLLLGLPLETLGLETSPLLFFSGASEKILLSFRPILFRSESIVFKASTAQLYACSSLLRDSAACFGPELSSGDIVPTDSAGSFSGSLFFLVLPGYPIFSLEGTNCLACSPLKRRLFAIKDFTSLNSKAKNCS